MFPPLPKLIVILGPTASGKTDLALKLAKKLARRRTCSGVRLNGGEIISADSRQIYQEMDIGTNKVKNEKLKIKNYNSKFKNIKNNKSIFYNGIPHYMIDIIKPNQNFTVAQFKKQAVRIIKDIIKKNKTPFLVGGTGLYISSIVNNLEIPKVKPNKALRKKIEKEINQEIKKLKIKSLSRAEPRDKKYKSKFKNEKNWSNFIKRLALKKLYQKLLKLDPLAKNFVQPKNQRRIIRALEVCLTTKKPFSQQRQIGPPLFDVLQIGVKLPREKLYQKINQRVDQMIKDGLVKEVKSLSKKYNPRRPAMSGIGYREIIQYLQKNISLDEAINLIKKNTRHYARRQTTWFKKDKNIRWITTQKQTENLIKKFLIGHPAK